MFQNISVFRLYGFGPDRTGAYHVIFSWSSQDASNVSISILYVTRKPVFRGLSDKTQTGLLNYRG